MSSELFVSVIVCAFNEERILNECLNALNCQSYLSKQYEIIIIDDESTDRTFEIAKNFIKNRKAQLPRVRVVRIQHGGLSIARNTGIHISKGDVVAFIDGDAVADKMWLEELVRVFEEGADYTGGRINLLNDSSWVANFLQNTRYYQCFGPTIYRDELIGCNMAFRREVFTSIGGFYENFTSRGDDTTIHSRLRETPFKYTPAPKASVLHERPDTLAFYMKVEWKSATLKSLCQKATPRPSSFPKKILHSISQTLFLMLPILAVYSAFDLRALPLLILSVAILVRKMYFTPHGKLVHSNLTQNFSKLRSPFIHATYLFVSGLPSYFGKFASPFLHRKSTIVEPMTTNLHVLTVFDSVQQVQAE